MLKLFIFTLFCISHLVSADDCTDCLTSGKHWCPTVKKCVFQSICPEVIKKPLNCPKLPDPAYAYNDEYTRTTVLLNTAAAYSPDPQKCFTAQNSPVKVKSSYSVNCTTEGPQVNCFAYSAFDTVNKAIIVSFRGTEGNIQLFEEIADFFNGKEKFFDSGHIFKYFYEAFLSLWNGGMQQDMRNLKYLYPNYEVWVNGHSLGGAMASVAASYMVKIGLFEAKNIKLVTFGQPRTGDYDFAVWHDQTFPYSYRVVHHRDIAPHIPPQNGEDELFHHRTEIWYNNDMSRGKPYEVCAEADGLYCSNTQFDTSAEDHQLYFHPNMPDWGTGGCTGSM